MQLCPWLAKRTFSKSTLYRCSKDVQRMSSINSRRGSGRCSLKSRKRLSKGSATRRVSNGAASHAAQQVDGAGGPRVVSFTVHVIDQIFQSKPLFEYIFIIKQLNYISNSSLNSALCFPHFRLYCWQTRAHFAPKWPNSSSICKMFEPCCYFFFGSLVTLNWKCTISPATRNVKTCVAVSCCF